MIWPLIFISILKTTKRSIVLICIVILIYTLRIIPFALNSIGYPIASLTTLGNYFIMGRFDNMAIGGLLAIMYFHKQTISKTIQLISLGILVLSLFMQFNPKYGSSHIYYSILFAISIYHFINAKKYKLLNNITINYLGKISYGIYMYHLIAIYLTLNILSLLHITHNSIYFNISLYVIAISITILLASLSYEALEKRILRLKDLLQK